MVFYYYYSYIIYLALFCSLRIIRFFIIPRGVFVSLLPLSLTPSRRKPPSPPPLSRLLKDPARRRSRRFASLFAKKLFQNKFTRAMTLVVVICAYTYISHVNNIHRCAIMARWTSILYFVLFSPRRIAVVILWVIN